MKSSSITRKFLIGVAALFVPLIAISLWGVSAVKSLQSELKDVSRNVGKQPVLVGLEVSLNEFLMPGNDILITGDVAAETANFKRLGARLTQAVETFKASGMTYEELGLTQAEFDENMAKIREICGKIMVLRNPKGNPEGPRLMEQMDAHSDLITGKISEAGARLSKKVDAQLERFGREVAGIVWTLAVLIPSLFLLCALAATALAYRGMVVPIMKTSQALELLAAGNLTAKLAFSSDDEVGRMGESFNTAMEKLGRPLGMVLATVGTLSASAEELRAISQEMTTNAGRTSSQAQAVSSASEQISANVQTVASNAEEMTASIKEISRSSSEAAKVADQAVRMAAQTSATITQLSASSVEIGNVIKVISGIAGKTNLLALNASIEAARAGEAGKGFAVVANEVKELAKAVSLAADDVSKKIAAIQNDTGNSVEAIGRISAIISQVNDIQNSIASAVEEQTSTTGEIGRNVAQAAKGSMDIAKNIAGVAASSNSTATGASSTQSASGQLAQMAAELQKLVSAFTL